MPTSFSWTVGSVTAGHNFVVDVASAPCSPVSVRFYVNGVEQARKTVTPPGACTFKCPPNTTGQSWTVVVECPSSSDSQGGVVG